MRSSIINKIIPSLPAMSRTADADEAIEEGAREFKVIASELIAVWRR